MQSCTCAHNQVTVELALSDYFTVCEQLRDLDEFHFEQLVDLCGVDYSTYHQAEWTTDDSSHLGFSRAVHGMESGRLSFTDSPGSQTHDARRYAVVVHLLSYRHNQRLRLRVYAPDNPPVVPSITSIWKVANWYEREAFDLYGILFDGHPDLRRILTDYNFDGHPLRKDFPLVGHVEMRYDETLGRVAYEPVSIEPRVLVPRVNRDDSRYAKNNGDAK